MRRLCADIHVSAIFHMSTTLQQAMEYDCICVEFVLQVDARKLYKHNYYRPGVHSFPCYVSIWAYIQALMLFSKYIWQIAALKCWKNPAEIQCTGFLH